MNGLLVFIHTLTGRSGLWKQFGVPQHWVWSCTGQGLGEGGLSGTGHTRVGEGEKQ